MRLALSAVVLGAVASACGGPSGGATCLPDCPGTRAYDAVAYELSARFDWDRARLVATEAVTLALSSSEVVVELDSAVEVKAVRAGAIALPYLARERLLTVDLGALEPGSAPVTFTVDYEAAPSDGLFAAGARDDDPVLTRVVYTDSEPARGAAWLVAKHHPSDRARWAVELTVQSDEDAVSNGRRVLDEVRGTKRVVRYELAQPLPTYLMAFALGPLEHVERNTGTVPLALWHRRGLVVDPHGTLDTVAASLATFERLLGPYPFETYAVVLLPQYGGGMENATITFNGELYGQGVPSASLNAHELAHQWFGDVVTMRDYDDVWVKEGLATLLTSEATRAGRDGEGRGRRFGADFLFSPDEAIVDALLTGLDKYTSGPYERGAWLLSQLRERVGEQDFWSTLRGVLSAHAWDSVDGPTFVRSFAPALDEATIAKALGSLPSHEVPSIGLTVAPRDGGTDVTFAVTDSTGTLVAPIEVTVVDGAGAATLRAFDASAPLTVTVPEGGYLAPDERDVHPYWSSSFSVDRDVYFTQLAKPLFTPPASGPARTVFESRSAVHQERALFQAGLPPVTPEGFGGLLAALDSKVAVRQAVVLACDRLRGLAPGPEADAWTAALVGPLRQAAAEEFNVRWGRCPRALVDEAVAPEFRQLTALASWTPAQLLRLEYLVSFDYGPEASFASMAALATTAPTLRLRDQVLTRMVAQLAAPYTAVPDAARDEWRRFFRGRLDSTTSVTRFRTVWQGLVKLKDVDALVLVAPLLHRVPLSAAIQRATVCQAYALALEVAPAAWQSFREAARPWDKLEPSAAAVLEEPAGCQ